MIKNLILLTFILIFIREVKLISTQLVIISIDGFSSEFLDETKLPFIYSLLNKGVYSSNVYPVFPSKTFPNHHSIATGLYAENHGVIDNRMAELNDDGNGIKGYFSKDSNESFWYDGNGKIRPIYIANELAGEGRKSATIFWLGSKIIYDNHQISQFEPVYDKKSDGGARLNKAKQFYLSNLYNLIMVYLDDIDKVAHQFGPSSSSVLQYLKIVDDWVKDFVQILDLKKTNLVIVGDHGFRSICRCNVIYQDKYFKGLDLNVISTGSVVGAFPNKFHNLTHMNMLSKNIVQELNSRSDNKYIAYTKDTIPRLWHYRDHLRIPPILVVMKEKYYMKKSINDKIPSGDHGWPVYESPSMKTVFIGVGPSFRYNVKIESMSVVHHYLIFCTILNISKFCHQSYGSLSITTTILNYT